MTLPERIADLLEREREIVTSGSYDALPALIEEKTALLAALDSSQAPDELQAETLRDQARRNEALLAAAARGFQAAATRMRELTDRADLATYGGDGSRKSLAPTPSKLIGKF